MLVPVVVVRLHVRELALVRIVLAVYSASATAGDDDHQ